MIRLYLLRHQLLRDRTCGRGYRKLLVGVWSGSNLTSDPDRRIGSYYCGCIFFNGIGEKDLVNAAEHDAGCDLAPKVGGIVRLTKFILQGTFLIELIGAILMLPVFCRDYGWKGIWMSVFHSVSAFCNAGFDILGTTEQTFPSLTGYIANPLINIVIMLLIVIGGSDF